MLDKEQIGSRSGRPLMTRFINNTWWITEVESNIPDAYFVRGKNVLTNDATVLTKMLTSAELAQIAGGDTAYGGLEMPTSFVTPAGFTQKSKPDGAKYQEANDVTITTTSGAVIEIVTQPTKGTMLMNPNGSYTFNPTAGATGTDTCTYRYKYSDGTYSTTATVSITITSANQTPSPVPQKVTVEPNNNMVFTIPSGAYFGGTCKIYKNGSATVSAQLVDTDSDGVVTFVGVSSADTDFFEATWTSGSLSESPRSPKKVNIRVKPTPINDSVVVAYNSSYSGNVSANDNYASNMGFW